MYKSALASTAPCCSKRNRVHVNLTMTPCPYSIINMRELSFGESDCVSALVGVWLSLHVTVRESCQGGLEDRLRTTRSHSITNGVLKGLTKGTKGPRGRLQKRLWCHRPTHTVPMRWFLGRTAPLAGDTLPSVDPKVLFREAVWTCSVSCRTATAFLWVGMTIW